MTVMSSYEGKSGVRWNRVVPGFSLLRNAGFEAQQHDADTPLVRSLFITGLLYILEALPADLSEDEISAIRVKMPNTIQASNLHARSSDSHTLYIGDGRAVTHTDQPSRPSLIHRTLASSIIQFCLILQSLLPHIKLVVRNLLQSERMHQIAGSVVTTSMNAANSLCKSSSSFGSTAMRLGDGRIGRALLSLAMWWLAAVVGGIHEGVGEGLLILCGERQKSEVERW